MISHLSFTDYKKTPIPYIADTWTDLKGFNFTPEVNILWGANGSGKSSIIKCLSSYLHCRQGGISTVTETSVRELMGYQNDDNYSGMQIEHDGQAVRCIDGHHQVGLIGGAFDDDFMMDGLQNTVNKASAGQMALMRLIGILKSVDRDIKWRIKKDYVNDIWKDRITKVEEMLKPAIPSGKLTILMDEAELSMDYQVSNKFWSNIQKATHCQFIIASHHPFALTIPGANYIDLTSGYLESSRKLLFDKLCSTSRGGGKRRGNGKGRRKESGDEAEVAGG